MPAQTLETISHAKDHILPALRAICLDGDNGKAINLASFVSATFTMVSEAGTEKVSNATATIENSGSGLLRYDWDAADVDTSGRYHGFFTLTTADNKTERFPTGKKLLILIE